MIVYEGRIVGTATDPTDVLMATVGAFSDDLPVGDPDGVIWSPHEGPVYPADGDWCALVETDEGSWVVLAWKPA